MDELPIQTTAQGTVDKDITTSFPLQIYPKFFQKLLIELAETYQLPIEYFAASLLSATAAAMGTNIVITNVDGRYKNTPILWMSLVGPTGSGKTLPIEWFLEPLLLNDRDKFEVWKKETEQSDDPRAKVPPIKLRILSEATPEAVINIMQQDNPVTLYRDELLGFVRDFGRYAGARTGEEQTWLSIWGGKHLRVVRKKETPIIKENPFLGIIGGLQSELLREFLTHERLVSGFAQRFLYVIPGRKVKRIYSTKILNHFFAQEYKNFIHEVIKLPETTIQFKGECERIYANFFDVNNELKTNEENFFLSGVYAKFDIYFLRFAIVLHIIDYIENGGVLEHINENTFHNAALLCEYFRENAKRIAEILDEESILMPSKKNLILDLIEKQNLNDCEIAQKLGVSKQYVAKIRSKHNIPPKDMRRNNIINSMDL